MAKKPIKKGKKAKVKKAAFPIMDLPTELVEDICEILKAQDLKKTLASLNVANNYLRDVTSRYLWESVRWTRRSWASSFTEVSPSFMHVKYIMLVSPDEDEHSGWDVYDRSFWMPLFWRLVSAFPEMPFGRLAHKCFPELRYAVCLSAPSGRTSQRKRASVYVSDHNLIEKRDTEALRKMIFDTLREINHGKMAPRTFSDISDPPVFLADRLNIPDFEDGLKAVDNLLADNAKKDPQSRNPPQTLTIASYAPFRDLAWITVAGVKFSVHLLSKTKAKEMPRKVTGKRLDLFAVLRRLVTEDQVTYTQPRLMLSLDIDFSFKQFPANVRFFERASRWVEELARHSPILSKEAGPDVPFDLHVVMPEQFEELKFKSDALVFHDLLSSLHAKSTNGYNPRIPTSTVLHGFLDASRPVNPLFARMDFTSEEQSKTVVFGWLKSQSHEYHVIEYYYNGKEVKEIELCRRLERLFRG